MVNIEAQHYEREEMWEGYKNNKNVDDRVEKTLGLIPEDADRVLDIGCGIGSLTNNIDRQFVIGLDHARTPLKKVRKIPVMGSISALPIKPGTIDLVIMTEVLEHLDDDLYYQSVKEIERLKPEYILLSVPYLQCLEEGYCKCEQCGEIFHIDHHYRSFDQKAIENMFYDYQLMKNLYWGKCVIPNVTLIKFKHMLGLYHYSRRTICNKCGGHTSDNTLIKKIFVRYPTGILSVIDDAIKFNVLNKTRPTHEITLLKRK